jgi:hypothetical protein
MSEDTESRLKEFHLAKGEALLPENFPELQNLSAGFIFDFVPRPSQTLPAEFVYVPIETNKLWDENGSLKALLTITQWNALWEAGQLRSEFVPHVIRDCFPDELRWLTEIENANLYLIPNGRKSSFEAFKPLYYLLPLRTLERFGLPPLRPGIWPCWMYRASMDQHITVDFDDRVAKAFASLGRHRNLPVIPAQCLVFTAVAARLDMASFVTM